MKPEPGGHPPGHILSETTVKYGDQCIEELFLETDAGVVQAYASKALFLAAGWLLTWVGTDGVALVSQPTYTLADDGTGLGRHVVLYTIPNFDAVIRVTPPAGYRSDPISIDRFMGASDEDSVITLITAAAGVPVNQSRQNVYDFDTVEGDSFRKTVTIPLIALTDYGYADLADIGGVAWTVACMARKPENRLSGSPDFTPTATILSKTDRTVLLTFPAATAGAVVSASDATKNSQPYYYDVQLVSPVGAPSPAPCKISGVRGTITVKRQETTTP